MLDTLIKEKANSISYSQIELGDIAASSNYLRSIVQNEKDFDKSFLGGSYIRGTMVKGISDVDIYYQYMGTGNSQSALTRLKTCLLNSYPKTIIKQDHPSIFVDFNKIPFNITPCKKDTFGNVSIPNNWLNWQAVNFGELEVFITALRQKSSKYIDLIKILKLWNFNYSRGMKNFIIEKKVCDTFLYPYLVSQTLTDWLWTFFQNNGYNIDAQKIHSLMLITDEAFLKVEWLKFIDKK